MIHHQAPRSIDASLTRSIRRSLAVQVHQRSEQENDTVMLTSAY